MNGVTENKKFWKTIKPFPTEENRTTTNIILAENNQIVSEEMAICQICNTTLQHLFYNTYVTNGLNLLKTKKALG